MKPEPEKKRHLVCAIYTRKSTSEGLDQDFTSLDNQRESAENYIKSQQNEGWTASEERYDDGGFTGANIELATTEDRALYLRRALAPVRDQYDLVILDCPPALDLLTLNALGAADTLIVPMQAEYFALEGISELVSTLERVRASVNPELTIHGVLLTMYDERTNLAQQVTETLREYFRERLFKTVIPRNVRLAEAPSHGKPVAIYDPRSRGTEAYFDLATEFLDRNKIKAPRTAARKQAMKQPGDAKVHFWPYA